MRQPAEFSLDCTDDDGRWNEIIEMDAGDCDEDVPDRHHVDRVELGVDQKAGQVFQAWNVEKLHEKGRELPIPEALSLNS